MAVLSRKFRPEQDSEHFDPETGNCSIEYYNARKDPYRVSSNKIPVGWPWIVSRASEAGCAVYDQLEDSIRKLLSEHKIRATISLYNIAPQYTPEDANDTILIRTRDEFDISWEKTVGEI